VKKTKADDADAAVNMHITDYFSEDHAYNAVFLKWLETIVSIALIGLALFLVIKLLIGIIRGLQKSEARQQPQNWNDEVVRLRAGGPTNAAGKRKRPGNPKMAVRYYYWKFMQECSKRGVQIQKGWTAEELCRATEGQFQNAEVLALHRLYIPVRYDDRADVSTADAREAARLWHELKKSKPGA